METGLEDYCIRFYYRADSSVDLKHNNEYQRMLDTIYVDTDGSYTNTLTGEEGSVDENKSWLMRYSEEQESSNETEKVKEESLTPAGTDSKTVTSDNEEEPESNTVMRLEDVLNASQETEAEVETLEISNDEYAIRYLGYDYVPDNFYGIGIGGDATKTISVNFEYTNKTDEDRNVQDDFLITVEAKWGKTVISLSLECRSRYYGLSQSSQWDRKK